MGYQRSLLKLVWPEDSEFHGLEVRMRRLSIGQLQKVVKQFSSVDRDNPSDESFENLIERIAESLVDWNNEDPITEEPVPADVEGLRTQDPPMLFSLVDTWMEAAADVPTPLGKRSNSGQPSLEESIPMETL